MAKPEKMILICNNQRPPGHPRSSCADKGSRDVTMECSEMLDDRNLFGKVSLAMTGCIGPCSYGPIVAIMPDNVWYHAVTKDDLEEILDGHVIGGKPVERLIMPDEAWE